jgi:hypothetical protein
VDATPIPETLLVPPAKGKKVTNAALQEAVKPSLKDWGKTGHQYLETILL